MQGHGVQGKNDALPDGVRVIDANYCITLDRIDEKYYLVTRNVFNKIASKQATTIFIVEKEYRGAVNKWLALPSIF